MQGLVASLIFRKLRICFDKNEKDRDNTTLFLVREASTLRASRIDQTSVLCMKNVTFQNVAKNQVPYLGFQSTDLAELLAVSF